MKLTFEQRLSLLFAAIFIGLAIIGYVTYKDNIEYIDNAQWVRHTLEVLNRSDKILSTVKDMETGERGYVITGDTDFLEPFLNSKRDISDEIDSLKKLTLDNQIQQERIDSLTYFISKKIDFIEQTIYQVKTKEFGQARSDVATKEGKYWMDKIRKAVADIQLEENSVLAVRNEKREKSIKSLANILVLFLVGLIALLVAVFFTVRDAFFQRKATEETIRTANDFLDTILENIPNMIFVKDAKHLRFVRFNKAGEKLLGYNRNELLGKNDYDFFPKEEADAFTAKDKDVISSDSLVDIPEEPIKTKSGDRWLHTKKLPINDKAGVPLFLLGISEDITERKKSDDEIKQLNTQLGTTILQLQSANKEMEAFTYSVSHDLRAPLRIINGYAEILLSDFGSVLNEEGKNHLGVIMNNSKHMGQLIDDLLNFSRLGRAGLDKKRVDMNEIVKEVLDSLQTINTAFTAEIKVHDLPPAFCDSALVKQVWINLISNANKYSRNKNKPAIEIGSALKRDKQVYYVKDNGVGFDMQYYDKLFGVFQRLHRASEYEGTGVGLAIVQRIVTKHGGEIWAEAKEGEGATFYFNLTGN